MLWRRLDQPGHDAAGLRPRADGWVLEGAAVWLEDGTPCRLAYRVECDAGWRTTAAVVQGAHGARKIDVQITADASRAWTLNGQPCPSVAGCDDVDLSFTPATNLLPIRRLRLAPGERAAVRAAWLRFPDPALDVLAQHYAHAAPGRYRYDSGGGAFTAVLAVDATGWVVDYPGLWCRESQPRADAARP
jgi:hypothetical protein